MSATRCLQRGCFNHCPDWSNVPRYMAEYHIPRELQVSLREYFRHCRALSRQRYYHDLLVQMSPSLRGQVAVFCHSAWILKVPFFNSPSVSDEEREQFIIQIAMAIEPEAYPPNEPIFRVNNPAMQMYILQKGVVAKQGRVLRGGAYFGEDMILKNYKRPYSVRTLTYVDCFRLDKEKLLDIIRHDEFPATRIAIRRATIALAFRVKFMLMAKAVGCVLGVGLHVVSLATHTYMPTCARAFVCVRVLPETAYSRALPPPVARRRTLVAHRLRPACKQLRCLGAFQRPLHAPIPWQLPTTLPLPPPKTQATQGSRSSAPARVRMQGLAMQSRCHVQLWAARTRFRMLVWKTRHCFLKGFLLPHRTR